MMARCLLPFFASWAFAARTHAGRCYLWKHNMLLKRARTRIRIEDDEELGGFGMEAVLMRKVGYQSEVPPCMAPERGWAFRL
jgi:hypothetical protein